jgi:hypothetical protein
MPVGTESEASDIHLELAAPWSSGTDLDGSDVERTISFERFEMRHVKPRDLFHLDDQAIAVREHSMLLAHEARRQRVDVNEAGRGPEVEAHKEQAKGKNDDDNPAAAKDNQELREELLLHALAAEVHRATLAGDAAAQSPRLPASLSTLDVGSPHAAG